MRQLLFLFIISTQFSLAQLPANQLIIDKAIELYLQQDLKKAEETYLYALTKTIQSQDSVGVLSCYAGLYSCLSMQDNPLAFLKYEKEINSYASSKNIFSCYTLQELGHIHRSIGEFEIAKKYYQRADLKYKSLNISDFRFLANNYQSFGVLASEIGDYDTAIAYFKQSLEEFLKQKDIEEPNEIAMVCIRLSTIYTRKQQFLLAQKSLKQGLKYAVQPSVKTNFYNSLAEIYLPQNLNKPDSAILFLNKAVKIAKTENLENRLGVSYLHLANIKISTEKFEEANTFIDNAFLIFDNQKNKLRLGQIFQLKGLLAEKQKKYTTAFEYYGQSVAYFSDGNQAVKDKIIYKNDALKSINGQLNNLLYIFQEKKQSIILYKALELAKKADNIIDYQRNSFQLEASKLFLTQLSHEIYVNAIEICFQLHSLNPNKSFLQEGFYFSEKNKAIVLYESLKFSRIQRFGSVPQSLIQKEVLLNKQITFFENLIYRDEKKKPNQVADSRTRLLKTTEDLEKLKNLLRDNYPEYYQYKYDTEPISVNEVKTKLTDNQALIEHFISKNTLFTFLITQKETHFFKQNLPVDFKQNISTFKNKIIQKSVASNYIDLSLGIYSILFSENINIIINSNKIENIEIIPDAELNYIPFESLLVRRPKNLKETRIYLLEHYTIGYLPSATMNWKNTIPETDKSLSKKYIGFAPKYKKPLDLPNNQANVSFLSKLFSGESFVKTSASKQNFDIQSQNHTKILHLSMHAGASPTDPMESYMAFEKDSLFVHDIYARSIPAELAILDACETGVGILSNGEGVMNLSRAFLHAGCQSVAMSLWKLTSSPETSEIIKDFITLVENGKPKDEALRTAKLNYLNKHRKDLVLSHPFYWSPLILVGKPEAIVETNWAWWIFGGISLVLMGVLLLRNARKASS